MKKFYLCLSIVLIICLLALCSCQILPTLNGTYDYAGPAMGAVTAYFTFNSDKTYSFTVDGKTTNGEYRLLEDDGIILIKEPSHGSWSEADIYMILKNQITVFGLTALNLQRGN